MPPKFALVCATPCQGLVVADGDIHDTLEEAQAELSDLRESLVNSQ